MLASCVALTPGGVLLAQDDAEEALADELAEEAVEGEVEGGDEAPEEESGPLVPASPTAAGGSGLFHLSSAQTGPFLSTRLSVSAQFFSGESVVRQNDEADRFLGALGLSITAQEWLEPYLLLHARSSSNSFNAPETVLAQGDFTLGSKAVFELTPTFFGGVDLRFMVPTRAGSTSYNLDATSVRFAALATFDATRLDEGALPLKIHANVGALADNSDQLLPSDSAGRKIPPSRVDRFSQGLSAFGQIQLGLGVEAPLPYVTPSLEWNLGIYTGDEPPELCADKPLACPSEAGFGADPQNLTLGAKTMPLPGLIVGAALDIGLTTKDAEGVPVNPPWNFIFGLTYEFDPRGREKLVEVEKVVEVEKLVEVAPKVGVLVGQVLDADTGKPVPGAVVEYVDQGFTRQAVDADTGAFRSYGLPLGQTVVVQVTAPDYKVRKIEQTIAEGEAQLEVKLKPEGKSGTIRTVVLDPQGDPLTSGQVVFTGPRTYTVQLDGKPIEQKVLVGQYTVAITSPGFLTAGRDVAIEAKDAIDVEIKLSPRPQEASVNVGETRILIDGGVEFDDKGELTPAGRQVLDQVVSAMLEHPEFTRVRVESHWDDAGNEARRLATTEERARRVMDYLVSRGISPKRLESKGFGAEQPLVPNTSARNRAINRRIEFAIVSTSQALE